MYSCTLADFVVSSHDWEIVPAVNTWKSMFGWTDINVAGSGGNTGKWLKVQFPSVSDVPGEWWWDVIYVDANKLYA